MAVSKDVLGMNARNFLYINPYNPTKSRSVADNKLETKKLLIRNSIPTPRLIASFASRNAVRHFNWNLAARSFVIKPARGYGGEGIIPFKKWENEQGETVSGQSYSVKQLESHLLDILDGVYSLQYLPDAAFIEERVVTHPFFRKLTPVGLPDIRVIVFNSIPIMAMLRLPTRESKGKANLHMGGLAIGIDLNTGITTYGFSKGKMVKFIPDTKMKVSGIKIPDWQKILLLSANTQAVSGLGYLGVDIVIDKDRGPLILEVNARPGLAIQNANMASLRTRLERIEDMQITSPARGVELSRSLFAESFSEKVKTSPTVLSWIEPITIYSKQTEPQTVLAKVDTGAFRTSIDKELAEQLQLPPGKEHILIKAANAVVLRPSINISFSLAGKKINTVATIADRSHLKYRAIIGRRDMAGFLVDPSEDSPNGAIDNEEGGLD